MECQNISSHVCGIKTDIWSEKNVVVAFPNPYQVVTVSKPNQGEKGYQASDLSSRLRFNIFMCEATVYL